MKKYFVYAFMAMTVALMSSCMGSGNSNRYADGKEPKIDADNCTVNGRHYDNTKDRCWKVTSNFKASVNVVDVIGINIDAKDKVYYTWSTEFELVSGLERDMYLAAQGGDATSASYKYSAVSAKNSEACYDMNDK
ncbi:MAG: hypothetical protein K6A36_02220 [Paludibacteraceae bacterium]|nr:hypothetical protein [Paludibacteraceae bacterium]